MSAWQGTCAWSRRYGRPDDDRRCQRQCASCVLWENRASVESVKEATIADTPAGPPPEPERPQIVQRTETVYTSMRVVGGRRRRRWRR